MSSCRWCLVPVLGLVLLSTCSIIACGPPSPAGPGPPTAGEALEEEVPAEFQVGAVTFIPSTPMAGDSVTVSATVTNTGGVRGAYAAILSIDGQEAESKDVSVGAGQSEEVRFEIGALTVGDHTLAIGQSSVAVTISDWSPYIIKYDEPPPGYSMVRGGGYTPALYVTGDYGHITRFTPPSTPFRIERIGICAWASARNTSELRTRHITVRIWNSDSSQQLWSQDFPWSLFLMYFDWSEIEVPDIRVEDDFHVEVVTHGEPSSLGWGLDPQNVVWMRYYKPRGPRPGIDSPLEIPETRSGYSYMGKRVQATKGMYERIKLKHPTQLGVLRLLFEALLDSHPER